MKSSVALKTDRVSHFDRGHLVSPIKRVFSSPTRKTTDTRMSASMGRLSDLFTQNKKWAEEQISNKSDYFSRFAKGQAPDYLYIGCSDSRVVPTDMMCKGPGDIFVHRNVGNIVDLSDMNLMSVLEYGVGVLKAKHIIICGHYGCGANNATLSLPLETPGIVNSWLSSIRRVVSYYADQFLAYPEAKRNDVLVELNAMDQMMKTCTTSPVLTAWKNRQELYVHCVIYDVANGQLLPTVMDISSLEQLSQITDFQGGIIQGNKDIVAAFTKKVKDIIATESVSV